MSSAAVGQKLPPWAALLPLAACGLLAAQALGLLPAAAVPVLVAAAGLLGGAVFAAVHHAEVLALRVGEPFGSIILAVAVTVIEVALIVSILLSATPGSETVARDTVFAAVMIVLNGIVGLCLVLGGRRHREQAVRVNAAAAALAVLGTLAVVTLVLPNYTDATRGPTFATAQLVVIGGASLLLYMTFIFVQTIRHRDYFLDVAVLPEGAAVPLSNRPRAPVVAASAVLLVISLTAVVLLAKLLSAPLGRAVAAAGLPNAVVGVAIAGVVLLPEGMAAVKAALANRLQSSMNLALGSAVASIGLTVPAVAVVSVVTGRPLILGLTDEKIVLLALTLYVASLTLGTGRTTVLQGAVHLVVFAVFLLLAVVP